MLWSVKCDFYLRLLLIAWIQCRLSTFTNNILPGVQLEGDLGKTFIIVVLLLNIAFSVGCGRLSIGFNTSEVQTLLLALYVDGASDDWCGACDLVQFSSSCGVWNDAASLSINGNDSTS